MEVGCVVLVMESPETINSGVVGLEGIIEKVWRDYKGDEICQINVKENKFSFSSKALLMLEQIKRKRKTENNKIVEKNQMKTEKEISNKKIKGKLKLNSNVQNSNILVCCLSIVFNLYQAAGSK